MASGLDFDAAAAGARAGGDVAAEVDALYESGMAQRFTDVAAAVACHEQASQAAASIGDVPRQVAQLGRLSLCHSGGLRLDEAQAVGDRALALARDAGDDQAITVALDAIKRAALQAGDLELLQATIDELLDLRGRADGEWVGEQWYDWLLLERAFIPIARARWDDAVGGLQEALDANRRLLNRVGEPLFVDALCWCHRSRGDSDAAIAAGRQAVALATEVGSDEWLAWTSATLGWALLDAGDPAAAIEPLERGLAVAGNEIARAQRLRCTALLAWARSEIGDAAAAETLAEQGESLLSQVTVPSGRAPLFFAHAIHALARVRIARGEPERAEPLLVPLVAAAEDAGWLETIAVGAVLLGRCQAARGDAPAGTELIARGAEVARTAGLGAALAEAGAARLQTTS